MRPAYTFLTVVSLVLLLFAGVAQVSWAGDYQVDDFGDAFDDVPGDGNCATEDDTCTLRAAIQEASATPLTDNVTFSGGGTIFLTLGALSVQDDMTIFNGSPASVTVDGGGGNSIFVIGSSIDNDLVVTIEGLTLTNAGGASSSAIQIATDAGSTRIEDCVVTGNNITAGAIQAQGNVLILETEITGNTSSTNGAGLQIPSVKSPHTVTIRGVLIEDNISNSDGVGISTSGSLLTIQNSEIRGNMALDSGGGIHLIEGEMSISNSQIIDNSITGSGPTASGGGIWFTALAGVWNGLAIGDSTIAENEAPNSGGGIYFSSNHPFLMTNSTISENVTGPRSTMVRESRLTSRCPTASWRRLPILPDCRAKAQYLWPVTARSLSWTRTWITTAPAGCR